MITVDIEKVTDAIEMTSDCSTNFYDVQKNDVIFITEGMDTDEQQEIYDRIDRDPNRYYSLPTQYDRVPYHGGLH